MLKLTIRTFVLFLFLNVSFSAFARRNSDSVAAGQITVYVFLSESCPICQNYTLTLKELNAKYKDRNIRIIGVFPDDYSTQEAVDEFKKTYSIPFDLVLDASGTLTKHFNAGITPEAFVQDANGQLVYRGRIDDSFYGLGKRRNVITSTDLDDALSQLLAGQKIKNPETTAVGCIITLAGSK